VQTAHGLRGQKMEDLIFNGTRKRQPSGLARVTLTVSREGEAPLVLNGEELDEEKLTITHRLYRSGESRDAGGGRRRF
jgi:chromosome segregation protein